MSHLVIVPGPITRVTLNRPAVRNALDDATIAELRAWAESVPADGTVRAVVLGGAGPVFCAGADLAWMARVAAYTPDENLDDARQAARMFLALDRLPVPLVARVQGAALGGGAGLVAVADIVVAADAALFGFTETTIGLVPALISPYVVRKIGVSAARALCLTGERFPAAHARQIGLVHDVVAESQLDAAIDRHLAQIQQTSPAAVAATKRLLREVAGRHPADVLALTADAIATQRASPDGQEGTRAFLEKRPPRWTRPDR